MSRKIPPRHIEPTHPLIDVGLGVKDGMREVRFKLMQGARQLVKAAQAVVHAEDAKHPLSRLGEPLDRAVSMLKMADRAAVDFLSSDGPYRGMSVPLRSSSSYFGAEAGGDRLAEFIHDHYWRYRHWITLKGSKASVFVREQGIARAGAHVANEADAGAAAVSSSLRNARVVLSLGDTPILEVTGDGAADLPAHWPWHVAFCTVLAGEIAPSFATLGLPRQTAAALELADEITTALRPSWLKALQQGPRREEAIAACLDFALKHH